MKHKFLSIGLVIALGLAVATPAIAQDIQPAIATTPRCDLGPSEVGREACYAAKILVEFPAHPTGDAESNIAYATDKIDAARLAGVPHVVLLQMQLPWLIAQVRLANAQRYVEAAEEAEKPLASLVMGGLRAIDLAIVSGADQVKADDLRKRMRVIVNRF